MLEIARHQIPTQSATAPKAAVCGHFFKRAHNTVFPNNFPGTFLVICS
jgi:hypothetical protein